MTTPIVPEPPRRLGSIDAFRGLVMFLMMAEVLHLHAVSDALSRSAPWKSFWEFLAHHQTHVEWIGCSLHDLIQPSFSFLVGVALPFSIASRIARGQSRGVMIGHALWRSLVLVLLGIFLRSMRREQTYYTFEDTLTQIGLGYPFLFALGFAGRRGRLIALGAILVGYWAAFALYPVPGSDFDYTAVGVPSDWPHLMTGFEAHWNKNSNLAWAFDRWFLNLFPRESRFEFNGGGYATLSFIPTLGTMILGLLAGDVLKREGNPWRKVAILLAAGLACLVAGAGLGAAGICPVAKRIWTPSWVLFSGGWAFLFLAIAYALVDLLRARPVVFPLIVIGSNSIAAYCMSWLFEEFIGRNLTIHLGRDAFLALGPEYEPLLEGGAILLVFWGILFWMYRRRLFLKI